MRIGFSVKVLGQAGLKSHDTRRWQNSPHLSVSLAYLRDILGYLERSGLRMYRMAADLAPYLAHPDLPQFAHQIEECEAELSLVGEMASALGVRLSFHPSAYVALGSPEEAVAARSARYLIGLARILDAMGLGPEAVVVVHVGGAYEDREAALARWAARYDALPEATRRRLALENDDSIFSLADVYRVHRRTGVPLVFDYLHYLNHNPEGIELAEAIDLALNTWPKGVRPKVHFSSPRTEVRQIETIAGTRLEPPLWTQHADYVNPFEFIHFLRAAKGQRPFDVMLEARACDLAALRLQADLTRYAPELATWLEPRACQIMEPPELYAIGPDRDEGEARVLVVVMNNLRDFALAREAGWYRIPLARAPRLVAADYLAFYQTRVFGDEAWAIHYYAPVRRYRIMTRVELLPEEPNHPRAYERYYKIELGPLRRLERPIPSRRLRRITFIPTTLSRLLRAQEINDLWMGNSRQERLWAELKACGIEAEREYLIQEAGQEYIVPLAVPCHIGGVALIASGEVLPKDAELPSGWAWFPVAFHEKADWLTSLQREIARRGGIQPAQAEPADPSSG
ncbi:MAG: UV DNA damage repair endonuclease UvsE [Anaerolineae bacterium]|nr:UV DNA damage repair endonuclease UvsE [Anaerolineae bacterium]MDW8098678.1 UV DNA damage repair endonuclease UvsE [Anaerolineae bacterium]